MFVFSRETAGDANAFSPRPADTTIFEGEGGSYRSWSSSNFPLLGEAKVVLEFLSASTGLRSASLCRFQQDWLCSSRYGLFHLLHLHIYGQAMRRQRAPNLGPIIKAPFLKIHILYMPNLSKLYTSLVASCPSNASKIERMHIYFIS